MCAPAPHLETPSYSPYLTARQERLRESRSQENHSSVSLSLSGLERALLCLQVVCTKRGRAPPSTLFLIVDKVHVSITVDKVHVSTICCGHFSLCVCVFALCHLCRVCTGAPVRVFMEG
jgi:hypothetical protein